MRLPFLVLTPVSIFLGVAASYHTFVDLPYFELALVLLGALSAHISVNTLNEYTDFKSGLDLITIKTPFSGGSGALVENPNKLDAVLYAAIASLIITIAIGVYFIINRGFQILPIGLVGVLIILSYTKWLNRYPLLCLLAPGIAFGPLMVIGTSMVLTGHYSYNALYVSLVPFLLASNLLLLNQFPDIEADKTVGRRHFPIAYGIRASAILYGVIILAVYFTVVIGVQTAMFPPQSYFALIPMLATILVFIETMKHQTAIDKLIPYMGLNVLATVITPLILGLAMIYS